MERTPSLELLEELHNAQTENEALKSENEGLKRKADEGMDRAANKVRMEAAAPFCMASFQHPLGTLFSGARTVVGTEVTHTTTVRHFVVHEAVAFAGCEVEATDVSAGPSIEMTAVSAVGLTRGGTEASDTTGLARGDTGTDVTDGGDGDGDSDGGSVSGEDCDGRGGSEGSCGGSGGYDDDGSDGSFGDDE
eukprot:TRINITY_DN5244_c0_g4_i1.p1 TRINITY_DN5244_c0_g4~~TRINITY_DN5244_c0_g4_i1.p1  ORF type:complete len:209 (+),score=30.14 TRINITY_DN5244_c0_g4_i1:53-628(+)